MSRRSVLLATTICVALGTSAATDAGWAHGGGGGGGGFRSADAPRMARGSSQPATPAEHLAPIAHTKTAPAEASQFTHHKVFKAGNGLTPTGDGTSPPLPHLIRLIKPTIPPAVNVPPQVATQSVPPRVGAGALATKPVIPSTAFPPVTVTTPANPVGNGVPAKPVGPGVLVSKPGIPPEVIPAKPVSVTPGTLADKSPIPAAGYANVGSVLITGPGTPVSPQPATPSQTPPTQPMHPMPGVFTGGGVVVAAGDVDLTDTGGTCYWIKRKLLTEDGEVIRHVKVCEVSDTDQP